MEDLKQQVIADLNKNKEIELKKEKKENAKLTKVTLYVKPENAMCKRLIQEFKDKNIKFKEVEIGMHSEVLSTVQIGQVPIVHVNNNYLVMGREFQTAEQCVKAIKFFAHPEYIVPDPISKLTESIKNLNNNLSKSMQNLARQIQPITKIMNEIAAEEKAEENEEKNK